MIQRSLLTIFIFFFCIGAAQAQDPFLKNFEAHKGNKYAGKVIFPKTPRPPFDQDMYMLVRDVSENAVNVPFVVGTDKSRIWMLSMNEGKLLLKHDHRHEDGTPDAVTNYGGWATTSDDPSHRAFPADEFTGELLPAAKTNEWKMFFDEKENTFNYQLYRDGRLLFHAAFDLSKTI